jgi:maltose alpha-D-glucosyltransferase/alpha-amylase
MPENQREEAHALLEQEPLLRARFNCLRDTRISGTRIRHHGDYHLHNVLHTGSDFVVVNFEGDHSRPMSERRIKRTPIKDVASMIRSFYYAAHAVLFNHVPGIIPHRDADPRLEKWATAWSQCVSALFLSGYLETAGSADFLPRTELELKALLDAYTLEKGLIEIAFELEHRPDWLRIPLRGVLEQLQ